MKLNKTKLAGQAYRYEAESGRFGLIGFQHPDAAIRFPHSKGLEWTGFYETALLSGENTKLPQSERPSRWLKLGDFASLALAEAAMEIALGD